MHFWLLLNIRPTQAEHVYHVLASNLPAGKEATGPDFTIVPHQVLYLRCNLVYKEVERSRRWSAQKWPNYTGTYIVHTTIGDVWKKPAEKAIKMRELAISPSNVLWLFALNQATSAIP